MPSFLAPLIALALALCLAGCDITMEKPTEAPKTAAPAEQKVATADKAEPVDINTATEEQLKKIPGLDEIIARKIIAGRPYTSKDELVTKQIIPKDIYVIIRERVIVMKGTAISR